MIIFKDPSSESFDFIEACYVSVTLKDVPYISKMILLKKPNVQIENKIENLNSITDKRIEEVLTFEHQKVASCYTKSFSFDHILGG